MANLAGAINEHNAGAILRRSAVLGAALLMTSTLISAQWLSFPTPGVPRKPDGSPNLSAPAPRTADGKPDFSGLWQAERNLPCPPDGCPDMQIGQEFLNIGFGLKDGLPFQPWAADLRKARMDENSKDDPASHCRPAGIVKMHTNTFYRKMVQIPGLLLILNERDAGFRQIFTDGRPPLVDPQPTPNGYSTAKWDGDVLVVQTNGFPDGQWLDRRGSPLTDAAKITERFHRVNYGRLEIELTVDDPKAYTKPWTIKLTQPIALDTELMDSFCMENERSSAHMVGK